MPRPLWEEGWFALVWISVAASPKLRLCKTSKVKKLDPYNRIIITCKMCTCISGYTDDHLFKVKVTVGVQKSIMCQTYIWGVGDASVSYGHISGF